MITYNDIVHLNSELYERGLYYRLEYVNKSKAAVYSLGSCACDGKGKDFHEYVENYFRKKGLEVSWDYENFMLMVRELE